MELFGVQELPNSKSISAPGWAYVPDTGANLSAHKPAAGKRAARNQPAYSAQVNTAKQDAKILRDLAALDRENHKDVQIPVPVRHRDNAGRATHGKVTPAVRKILQSQKTFANHLSDAEALAALTASQPQQSQAPVFASPSAALSRASPASSTPLVRSGSIKKGQKLKDQKPAATPISLRKASAAAAAAATAAKTEVSNEDTVMADIPESALSLLPLPPSQELKPHPGDNDPLLKSRIPPVPAEDELAKLVAAPVLTYPEARAALTDEDLRRPTRKFCEICGYHGRVRCRTCGCRVCALECLRVHQEDCYMRYGA